MNLQDVSVSFENYAMQCLSYKCGPQTFVKKA